jgi:NAD(P)-dependent dehydrogenase (short-subunit alcohol dehydrogenase family)
VNCLSAFLLTNGLRDALAAGRGRVVHMSSGVHSSGNVDLEQPDEPRFASPYAQSKIVLVMLAREQGERWRQLGVDVNACSPGLDRHQDGRLRRRLAGRGRRHPAMAAY